MNNNPALELSTENDTLLAGTSQVVIVLSRAPGPGCDGFLFAFTLGTETERDKHYPLLLVFIDYHNKSLTKLNHHRMRIDVNFILARWDILLS